MVQIASLRRYLRVLVKNVTNSRILRLKNAPKTNLAIQKKKLPRAIS